MAFYEQTGLYLKDLKSLRYCRNTWSDPHGTTFMSLNNNFKRLKRLLAYKKYVILDQEKDMVVGDFRIFTNFPYEEFRLLLQV